MLFDDAALDVGEALEELVEELLDVPVEVAEDAPVEAGAVVKVTPTAAQSA